MALSKEVRVLNILQIDICDRKTPIGRFCLFANDIMAPPVRNRLTRLTRTYYDMKMKECQKYGDCPLDCNCEIITRGHYIVRYRKGVFLDLDNEEYYYMAMMGTYQEILHQKQVKMYQDKTMVIKMDGYMLSLFFICMDTSGNYVELVTNNLCKIFEDTKVYTAQVESLIVRSYRCKISLKEPSFHPLDLGWARRACKIEYEYNQLRSAMTWLSTLGGAFSSLGDRQPRCALTAGRISVEQLRLALRLGDKIVEAQCKLYFCMSMIQRGRLSRARWLIFEQFMNQKNSRVPDIKTMNMCKGIWCRLGFAYAQRRALRMKQRTTLAAMIPIPPPSPWGRRIPDAERFFGRGRPWPLEPGRPSTSKGVVLTLLE